MVLKFYEITLNTLTGTLMHINGTNKLNQLTKNCFGNTQHLIFKFLTSHFFVWSKC